MSTLYFAICTEHEVSSGMIGRWGFADAQCSEDDADRLGRFLEKHGSHEPVIVTDQDDRTLDYPELI